MDGPVEPDHARPPLGPASVLLLLSVALAAPLGAQDGGAPRARARGRLVRADTEQAARARALAGEHCTLDAPHTYRIEQPGSSLDGALLAPVLCTGDGPRNQLHVRIVVGGHVTQSLDDHAANAWFVSDVRAVGLGDVDGDGLADPIVIASAMSGMGPDGAVPFAVPDFWLSRAEGATADPDLRARLGAVLPPPRTVAGTLRLLRRLVAHPEEGTGTPSTPQ